MTTAERRATGPESTQTPSLPPAGGLNGKPANASLAPTESAPVAPPAGSPPGGTAPAAAKPSVPGGKPGSPSAKPGDGTPIIPLPIGDENGSPTQLVTDALYSRVVSIEGEGSALLGEHSKTNAYTVGISPDNSSISLANDQRQYRIIADGSKGDFWAFNQVQTTRVAGNVIDLDGVNNHLKAAHSKTRAYTVGISGDTSTISLANDQRQYRIIADGSKGDFWAFNQIQTRRVATNFVDLEGVGNHIKAAHSKTGAYTVGIDGDSSTVTLANDQRQYRIIADGSKGDFWAFNQIQTRRVAANIVDLEGANNHIKFASSRTSVYTIGINGDDSQMAFANPDSAFYTVIVDGKAGDIVLTNADCAEDFDVDPEVIAAVEPGTVVSIDAKGRLRPSSDPYDRAVAGVISGAGRFRPAMVLDRQPGMANRAAVALVGKVFCKVDATAGPISPGDLLTTSGLRGHAMRVSDDVKAFGAVIGKALGSLSSRQGLIPMAVMPH